MLSGVLRSKVAVQTSIGLMKAFVAMRHMLMSGAGVTVRLVCKDRGKPTVSEIAKFNRQYKGLTVSYSDDFHDRFVIIDNAELHNLNAPKKRRAFRRVGREATAKPTARARVRR